MTVAAVVRAVTRHGKVHGRLKSARSMWRKMQTRGLEIHQIGDALGVRVIVARVADCYRVFERIHQEFLVLECKDHDYIRSPKPNGYRSLHATVVSPGGYSVEIQIRTRRMDTICEQGTAAHWRYKERSRH